jgi:serine protease Do
MRDFFRQFRQFQGEPPPEQQVRGLGSGVIVSEDGYVLTNNHVVQGADQVQVHLQKRELEAQVIGTDPKSDLAVLKVDAENLPYLTFGDSDQLKVGEWVAAIGTPFSLEQSLTVGIVSAKGRNRVGVADYEDFIQTDAAINHGNSGGALVNLDGELVGINTAIATNTGASNGVGFAIPINMAQRIMKSLIEEGKVHRGHIGIHIGDVSEKLAKKFGMDEARGAIITKVEKGSPGSRAGLEPGDIVFEFNSQPVQDVPDLRFKVASTKPGTDVALGILRDGKKRLITVGLEDQPADLASRTDEPDEDDEEKPSKSSEENRLGFEIRTLTPDLARELEIEETRGVLVVGVEQGGPAADAGLRRNDVILEVDREPVSSVNQFRSAIEEFKKGDSVAIRVLRVDQYLFLVMDL